MMTKEEITDEIRSHFQSKGWEYVLPGSTPDSAFCSRISLRPDAVFRRDGMIRLGYSSNTVKPTNIKMLKQVLTEMMLENQFCHIIMTVDSRVPLNQERILSQLGVGLWQLRPDDPPVEIRLPQLTCFRQPGVYERIPAPIRSKVQDLLRRISEEDTATAVMDLVQIVEEKLNSVLPNPPPNTLGSKLHRCRTSNLLHPLVIEAGYRINDSRIFRAHPFDHDDRRKFVVQQAQIVVDDALAMLFAIP